MRYVASVGARKATIEIAENGHTRPLTLDGAALEADWRAVGDAVLRALPDAPAGHYSLLIAGHTYEVYLRPVASADDDTGGASGAQSFEVMIEGRPYVVRLEDERARALAGLAGAAHEHGDVTIRAPMPGLVANLLVAPGDTVARGQTVVVLEAMKMENELPSPRAGVVRAVNVAKGQAVGQNDKLVVIGDPDGAAQPSDADDDE
jgi:biotin carboxyl carrier protein